MTLVVSERNNFENCKSEVDGVEDEFVIIARVYILCGVCKMCAECIYFRKNIINFFLAWRVRNWFFL